MRRSNVVLRLQSSLLEEARKVSDSEGVALNQFINVAVAEKLSALRPEEYFREIMGQTPMQITVETSRRHSPSIAIYGSEALEALAVEGYRSGALTHYQAGQLLGKSRFEFDDFLIERRIYRACVLIGDLEKDLEDLQKLRAQGLLGR